LSFSVRKTAILSLANAFVVMIDGYVASSDSVRLKSDVIGTGVQMFFATSNISKTTREW